MRTLSPAEVASIEALVDGVVARVKLTYSCTREEAIRLLRDELGSRLPRPREARLGVAREVFKR